MALSSHLHKQQKDTLEQIYNLTTIQSEKSQLPLSPPITKPRRQLRLFKLVSFNWTTSRGVSESESSSTTTRGLIWTVLKFSELPKYFFRQQQQQ